MSVSKDLHSRDCVSCLQRNPELKKANWSKVTQLPGPTVQVSRLWVSPTGFVWLQFASYFSPEKPGLVQRRVLWVELDRTVYLCGASGRGTQAFPETVF